MLLCIDFQPAYAESFSHTMGALKNRLLRASLRREEVHFIYNEVFSLEGEELGDPLERIVEWGLQENLPLKHTIMLRKNFGWISHLFRAGYERNVARSILKHLMKHDLSSSSDISGPDLERIVASSHEDFEGFWDCSPAAWEEIKSGAIAMPFIFEGGVIPWLDCVKASLSKSGGIVEVTGGFRHRCLDEMCLLLEAGGIPYQLNDPLIYSLPEDEPSSILPPDPTSELTAGDAPTLFLDLGVATV
ncbi:MAG: hypothetical protein DVB30_03125 [Verrucomicrobia bacterium]|jgi:hypothetical protein|nr:MAG: hypothetical protein DVB30_03125 [Verrucomicrobiota bacterium]